MVLESLTKLLVCGCCLLADPGIKQASDVAKDTNTLESTPAVPRTILLAVGKAKAADPAKQQERARVAVRKVTDAARQFQSTIVVKALTDVVMTREQFWRGEVKARVNGAIFSEQLQQLAQTTTAEDTVIVYTHSHGTRSGLDAPQPPGGMMLDPAIHRPETRGVFSWEEYAELILDIPAKNVVVLTMACYSGGLVERFNSPQVQDRWKDRREKEGRNLIVLTSQNRDLMSPPIVKGGELINPFTYAVAEALAGKADGFELVDGKPDQSGPKDGKLTAGELLDFVRYTTESTMSEWAQRKNIAKPQVTGCYGRNDVLLTKVGQPVTVIVGHSE